MAAPTNPNPTARQVGYVVVGVIVAAAAILMIALATDGAGGTRVPQVTRSGPVASLMISVTAAGEAAAASMECGEPSSGTGYLASLNHLGPACFTLVGNPLVDHYLRDGDLLRDRSSCRRPATQFVGNSVAIRGRYKHRAVDRTLTVSNSCHEILWKQLVPVVSQQLEPNVGDEYQGRDDLRWIDDPDA